MAVGKNNVDKIITKMTVYKLKMQKYCKRNYSRQNA